MPQSWEVSGIKSKILNVFLAVLAGAAIGLLVYAVGRPFALPWNFQISLQNPIAMDNSDQGFAIIDKSSCRLLLLDNDYAVRGAASFGSFGDRAERATTVEASDEGVYVLATNYHSGGQCISEEMLLEYGFDGDFKRVVASESVPLDEHRTRPAVCDIKFSFDGSMYVARRAGGKLQLIAASADNNYGLSEVDSSGALVEVELSSSIYDVSFSIEGKSVTMTTVDGSLYRYVDGQLECVTDSVEEFNKMLPSYVGSTPSGKLAFSDAVSGGVYAYKSDSAPTAEEISALGEDNVHACATGTYSQVLSNVHVGGIDDLGEELAVTVIDSDSFYILDELGAVTAQISTCGLTLALAARIVLTWLSAIYLLVLLMYVLVHARLLRKSWVKLAGCCAVALLAGATVAHAYQTSQQSAEKVDGELVSMSEFVTRTEAARIGDVMLSVGDRSATNARDYRGNVDAISGVADLLDVYIDSSSAQNLSRFYRLFFVSDTGDIDVFLDSTDALQSGSPVRLQELRDHIVDQLPYYIAGGTDSFTVAGSARTYRYAVSPIYSSSGDFVGLCSIGCFYDTQMQQNALNAIDQLMLAAMLAAACFLIMSQGRKFQKAFESTRRFRRDGDDGAAVVEAAHPVNFLLTGAVGTDTLLAVVIVTSMAKANGFEYVVFSASGVLAIQAFGSIFGVIAGRYLSQKHSARTVFLGAAALTLVALAGCIVGAATNNLAVFFASKAVSGFSLSGVLTEMVGLFRYQGKPGRQRDDEEKAVRWGNLSSTILSVMVAGYLVDACGNAAAYALSFAFALVLLVVGAFVLPRGFCFTESKHSEKVDLRDSARKVATLFKPRMFVTAVVLALPLVLVAGYNSYLFPLISEGYDMKVTYITNLYVVARAIAYLMREVPYTLLDRGVDKFALSATSVLVIGLTLLGFLLNQGMLWAIVTLVILAVTTNLAGACIKPIKDNIVIEHGYTPKEYFTVMSIVDKVLKVIQPVLLGVFVTIGDGAIACAALGAVTLACLLLFSLPRLKDGATTASKAASSSGSR